MGIFSKIKQALSKTKSAISYKFDKLFTGGVLDDDFYDELEMILLSSDIGATVTDRLLEELKEVVDKKHIRTTEPVKEELKTLMKNMLDEHPLPRPPMPMIMMVVGVNGVGKTTAIGKLAARISRAGKSVTIVAADTFRAAAADQLTVWAERAGVRIVKHAEGADPGAVVYDAIASFKAQKTDVLLIDTAGRLHNKKNLMNELEKMNRIIEREAPEGTSIIKFIVLDATTGQNAISQVEVFNEATDIDGIILTKLDGTAKGGVVLPIVCELEVPVVYIGVGEGIDDIEIFKSDEFVDGVFS
ncbi:MAG: signal recognition particle-docking protein FtsY [Firmicutes bacterium]|nr:signal recognition particle-docking protein FtsY [Bacillota bacterium]